jgi:hypothetical protein
MHENKKKNALFLFLDSRGVPRFVLPQAQPQPLRFNKYQFQYSDESFT